MTLFGISAATLLAWLLSGRACRRPDGQFAHFRGHWAFPASTGIILTSVQSLAGNVSTTPAPLSANPSRNQRCLRARVPMIANAYNYPFAGSRMMRDLLRGEAIAIGRERVTTMMRRMGIEALYRRPNTSKPAVGHKIYPYLLRGLDVVRLNQVWAMDITYIPMARGFVYLAAVLDWFSRRVLSWRVSITLEVEFCLDAVEEALARHGRPEIFNTDQGSQFTSATFTGLLFENAIAISMDGRGAWRDNVFVERLWRSVKYEEVHLRAYNSVGEARASIGRYLEFYNRKCPHSSLDARTPDQAYFDRLSQRAAA